MAITAEGLIQLGYKPEIDFSLQNDGGDTYIKSWMSGDAKPTQSQIEAGAVAWKTAYDAQAYSRSRAKEYPSMADQLDDIYHNGIDAWKATIKTTKDKYPKP
jgi:hypothetical protein